MPHTHVRDVTAPVIPGPVDTVPSRGLHSQLPTCMHMHTYNTGSIYLMFFISHKPNAEYWEVESMDAGSRSAGFEFRLH